LDLLDVCITIRVNYNSSHIELLLNSLTDESRFLSDECSEESLTAMSQSQSYFTIALSQSQSYFMTGALPPISSSWRQAHLDSRPVFFQLNTCGHNPYVTSSLTRGWVCRLQLLLVLASADETKQGPREGRTGDTPVGYSALRREQCYMYTHCYATG
jgi:hypothetical protein